MNRNAALAVFVATFGVVVEARAQTPAEKAQAEALFREARALVGEGKAGEACPKFAESQRLDPQIGTALNLGICHAKEGKTATAWAELREIAERAESAGDAARARLARKEADALEPSLARITIVPSPGLHADAVVSLDGAVVGRSALGSALPIDPGEHVVSVSAPGKTAWTKSVRVESADRLDVALPPLEEESRPTTTPAPAPTAREPDAGHEPPKQGSTPVLGYALLGIGVAGVGVGTVFGLQAMSKNSDADEKCSATCTPEGHALERDAFSASVVSTIAFGVGIGALAAGAYFVFFAKKPSTVAASSTYVGVRW